MTKHELKADRAALLATRKHWVEDYKKLELFGGDDSWAWVFTSDECPLCGRHLLDKREYIHAAICGRCPLDRDHSKNDHGCGMTAAPWRRARKANRGHDKPSFMRARAALLKRVDRAIARVDRELARLEKP